MKEYYIHASDGNGGTFYERVPGKEVVIDDKYRFFLRKVNYLKEKPWIITEMSTGVHLNIFGRTQKSVIEQAKILLAENRQKFEDAVKKAREKYGYVPDWEQS